MNKEILKKTGIIAGSVLGGIYVLFLLVPFFLNGVANSCGDYVSKLVEDTTGFKLKTENVRFVTTPKLTAGVKIGHLSAALPNGDEFLTMDNAQGKISLLPFLIGRVEIDLVGTDSISANLKVRNDGKFLIEEYIPQSKDEESSEAAEPVTGLPLGLKLSNHLPDIRVKNYKIAFTDMPTGKEYYIEGNDLNVTDFIINKKVKLSTDGKVVLDDRTPFTYDIKVLNKIMPEQTLEEMVFMPQQSEQADETQQISFNVIDIFKTIYNNQLTADIKTDITTDGTLDDINLNGLINVEKLSIAVDGKPLPNGNVTVNMKGKTIELASTLYTDINEETTLAGKIKTGKNGLINLTCKSNAKINNIFNLIDSIAKSVNYKDLDTLTATGEIDADFTIKADMKKVESSGYFKIPQASVKYGLYNVLIDKIAANIDFSNNMVNIKNFGFSVLNQPLNAYGTLKQDTTADLHLTADKLPIKGLLTAAGQLALLKENDIKSGAVSMDASVTGKLKTAQPVVNVTVDNVNILNKPSNTAVKVADAKVNIKSDAQKYNGTVDVNAINIINPIASVSVPNAKVTLDEKDVNIADTYLMLDNSRIDIAGKITDYANKNLAIDLTAKGALVASDLRSMIPQDLRKDITASGKLPVYVKITGNDKTQNIAAQILATPANYLNITNVDELNNKSTLINSNIKIANDTLKLSDTGIYAISGVSELPASSLSGNLVTVTGSVDKLSTKQILNGLTIKTPSALTFAIPGFKDSKVNGTANITVNGSALTPTIGGNINLPTIEIPSMDTSLKNTNVDLTPSNTIGGKGSVSDFKFGGITASNLSSNFSFINNILYLKGLQGSAFDGKFNGDIALNVINGNTNVDFHGTSMNAEKAIEGAAGLKNALSGTLGFNAKLTLNGYATTEAAMMQSIKGNVDFDIQNGTLGNIGRLENLLLAQNLMANGVIAAAMTPIVNMPVVQNTAEFKSITGALSLANGWADITSIKTSGPSMAYFIYGKYNLINATANVTILGRLGADVVAVLGPVGDLSVTKLTSFLPKFGTATANVINALTTNPKGERTTEIPALSNGSTNYKDFKVSFNGGVESSSSVKSFKWLSVCDTSEIQGGTVKEQLEQSVETIKQLQTQKKEEIQQSIEEVKNTAQQTAEDIKNQVQNTKDSINELKNLFKKPAATTEPAAAGASE